jgi:hypothetical protein
MVRFRNVQNDGNWKRGGIYVFEFLEYVSPPANGVAYVADESVTHASLMTNAELFGEDDMPVQSVLDFGPGYGSGLSQIYADEEYSWLGAAAGYITVIQTELIEETDDGDWYRATVKVAEDAPLGMSEICSIRLEGVVSIRYEIVDGAGQNTLYIEGDLTALDIWGIDSFTIVDSTGNDGDYVATGDYFYVEYDAETDRTRIYGGGLTLPSGVYDGYITDVVAAAMPG